MPKQLISEQTIIEAAKSGKKSLQFDHEAIVTAAARDKARQLGIRLGERKPGSESKSSSLPTPGHLPGAQAIIAIGSDHGGFQLKEVLKGFIESLGYKAVDLGAYTEEPCDYPDYAYSVARMVSIGEASKGIMIDSVGIASAIVANKVPGIRAACCTNEFSAQSSREHNDANVLTLGGKVLGIELAKSISKVWLETNFGGGRHQRRIEKIADIEKRFRE